MKNLFVSLLFISQTAFAGLPILDCNGNWTGGYHPDTVLVAPACQPVVVPALPSTGTKEAKLSVPTFAGSIRASGDAKNASFISFRQDEAGNGLLPSILAETKMDFSNGRPGASFALYGVARGVGVPTSLIGDGVRDIVGVHGTAYKDFKGWAAGVHADVYDSVSGGTAVGLNIEFPKTQLGTDTVGINIQPSPTTRGIIGIQLQNPEAYKYALVAANANWVFGVVDTVAFGMRFNKSKQRLEFIRNIGAKEESISGYIDMTYEHQNIKMNKGL